MAQTQDAVQAISEEGESMRIEPMISAFRQVRAKRHGMGAGSRLRALKCALVCYCVSNGCFRWDARLAWWLAIYGTPRLKGVMV